MIRSFIISATLATTLVFNAGLIVADELHQPKAAQPAAPAAENGKAVENGTGCMPDGSCCGQAACAKAAKAEGTAESAEADCPCKKKNKAAKGS